MNSDWIQWSPNLRVRPDDVLAVQQSRYPGNNLWWAKITLYMRGNDATFSTYAGSWNRDSGDTPPADIQAEADRLMDLITDNQSDSRT